MHTEKVDNKLVDVDMPTLARTLNSTGTKHRGEEGEKIQTGLGRQHSRTRGHLRQRLSCILLSETYGMMVEGRSSHGGMESQGLFVEKDYAWRSRGDVAYFQFLYACFPSYSFQAVGTPSCGILPQNYSGPRRDFFLEWIRVHCWSYSCHWTRY